VHVTTQCDAGRQNTSGKISALKSQNRIEEAIEFDREAIRLDPASAGAHVRLGNLLIELGRLDEDLELQRAYVALDPKVGLAHLLLGDALRAQGKRREAMAEHRQAIALNPKLQWAHYNLGLGLRDEGELDEAIVEFTKAVALAANSGTMRSTLHEVLRSQGRLAKAVEALRESIRVGPTTAVDHRRLGDLLFEIGRLDEAITAYRQAMSLANDAFSRDLTRPDLDRVERLAVVQGKLPVFLEGAFQPQTVDERLGLAGLSRIKKRYAASARLYGGAFAADPKLADDLKAEHRQRAAGRAAQAGTGQGYDASGLDEPQRVHLRTQALDWLRADLSLRTQQLETGRPEVRSQAREALREVRVDPDLACIREPDSLAKHPEGEQTAWRAFWAEMDELLKKAQGN
jgi:tetratricopeptide (TPR) repeat protein